MARTETLPIAFIAYTKVVRPVARLVTFSLCLYALLAAPTVIAAAMDCSTAHCSLTIKSQPYDQSTAGLIAEQEEFDLPPPPDNSLRYSYRKIVDIPPVRQRLQFAQ